MGDVARGTWVKIKPGVIYQGQDLSNKFAIVVDSESYIIVELAEQKIKLLRTEIAEYLKDDPVLTFDIDIDDWQFTF